MEKIFNSKRRDVVMRIIPIMLVIVMTFGMIPVNAKTKKNGVLQTVEVSSQKELVKQLKTDTEEKIIFTTDKAVSIKIPAGTYNGKKYLVITAVNASVTNKANFASVTIEAVKDYTEKVSGNKINVSSDGACINVHNKKKVEKLTIDAAYVKLTVKKTAIIKNLIIKNNEGLNVNFETTSVDDTVTITNEEYERYQYFSELLDMFDKIRTDYYKETDPVELVEGAARGMFWTLDDPYSFYYNPQEFEDTLFFDESEYVGIGADMVFDEIKNAYVVSRVHAGSPAEEAGVQIGDILYRVGEDFYVTPENINEAVKIIRGSIGTDVDVTFLRNGEEITFTITRNKVMVNETKSTMINDEIGYIALHEFAGRCEKDFETRLNDLVSQGANGIIIDLRDNHGGWVEQARYIADLFMDEGELCYLVYAGGKEKHDEYRTTEGKADVKLVVLINENSASSSEILTGALRECADASVVGVKSYGKGVIQEYLNVGNRGAGFQLTVAQYFTPNGTAVHGIGITPDYIVEIPEGDSGIYKFADTENDVQLKKAIEVLKEKLH